MEHEELKKFIARYNYRVDKVSSKFLIYYNDKKIIFFDSYDGAVKFILSNLIGDLGTEEETKIDDIINRFEKLKRRVSCT